MPEPQEVVNAGTATTPDQTVQNPVEETTVEQPVTQEQETPEQTATTAPDVVKQEGDVDEMGVPYKNRYMEMRRKYGELESNLPTIIQQAVREVIPAQQAPQTPQYTEEQLIQFKESSTDANARAWAEVELRKLADRKQEEKFRSILEERERKLRVEQEQQMAFNTIRSKYSVAFNPDGSPNMNHPLTQMTVAKYNSDPSLKNHGQGLLIAADRAFADYVLQTSPQLAQQTKQLKRQVKKLEKATLVEGGTQQQVNTSKSPLSVTREQLYQKGDEKSLEAHVKELLKARGIGQSPR